jgi:hypothetical protein
MVAGTKGKAKGGDKMKSVTKVEVRKLDSAGVESYTNVIANLLEKGNETEMLGRVIMSLVVRGIDPNQIADIIMKARELVGLSS